MIKSDRLLASITPDDWIIAVSEATKADLIAFTQFDPRRIFVIPPAAHELFHKVSDPKLLAESRKKHRIPLDTPYVLSVSTLEPRKNIDHLVRCFVRLVEQERITDLNLVLVGTKGWDFDRIFREISLYPQYRHRIIVTGFVADQDLAALYSGAEMFVYPSHCEGFGLPVLEAMQCGTPVICSNTSSLPEVAGNAAILISPKDSDGLCQQMHETHRNSVNRELVAQRCLDRSKAFNWETTAARTLEAYATALRTQ